nr:PREDICTED: O-glucosyltransferase rumi homolog isoform X1 [Musa acuminata subsp. malaccensis]
MRTCLKAMNVSLENKANSAVAAIRSSTKGVAVVFLTLVVLVVVISTHWIDGTTLTTISSKNEQVLSSQPRKPQSKTIILACGNQTTPVCQRSLSPSPSPSAISSVPQSSPSCPDYFRWVHEDLRPWKSTGITEEMVGRARKFATFRLVVLAGRVYVERYRRAFQTRDVFTLWGILQLVSRYPGRVPDIDLMFNCDDTPVVKLADHRSSPPPPLFRYCKDDRTLDIVFPDWSFWGWAELNIKPWETLANDLKQGNQRVKWRDRKPYAYWKGNPWVSDSRRDLIKCNLSKHHDWKARLYDQNWDREINQGFKNSNLANQCDHRYKIYIEGRAWSVSQKYILACDSPAFFVKTHFHDFFSRALMPGLHFWPIKEDDKCRSIEFAVDWGNEHQEEVGITCISRSKSYETLNHGSFAGTSHGKGRQQLRAGRAKDGLRLRLHAAPVNRVRQAAEVRARRTRESHRALLRVHGLPCHRPRQGVPDGVDGEVDARHRAVRDASTLRSGGAPSGAGEES